MIPELGLKHVIPLSQNFFYHLLLRCWFEVRSTDSDDHSAYDHSAVRAACGSAGHQVVLSQSKALTLISLSACLQEFSFSLPFFKAAATCAISPFLLLPRTTSRAAVCSVASFLGSLNHAWVLHISMFCRVLGVGVKESGGKIHKRKQIRFLNLMKCFLMEPWPLFSKYVQKQKTQSTGVKRNKSYRSNYQYIIGNTNL